MTATAAGCGGVDASQRLGRAGDLDEVPIDAGGDSASGCGAKVASVGQRDTGLVRGGDHGAAQWMLRRVLGRRGQGKQPRLVQAGVR
jgi:hypothetical protein